MGEEMEGAMQHAPQPSRHFMTGENLNQAMNGMQGNSNRLNRCLKLLQDKIRRAILPTACQITA
jgi:hypothetical protein